MAQPDKTTTLEAYSPYAAVLKVDLEPWGAAPQSTLKLRFGGRSTAAQVLMASFPQPQAPQTRDAMRRLCDKMAERGFERLWFGLPFPNDPSRPSLEAIGFTESGTYLRLEKSLEGCSEPSDDPGIEFRPWSLPIARFAELAAANASGLPDAMDTLDQELVTATYLHELAMAPDCMNEVRRGGEFWGATSLGVFGGKRRLGLATPYLTQGAWRDGRAAQYLRAMLAYLKAKGAMTANVSAGAGQTELIETYRSTGFRETSRYVHLLKRLARAECRSKSP